MRHHLALSTPILTDFHPAGRRVTVDVEDGRGPDGGRR
jgi:hypothetical protein